MQIVGEMRVSAVYYMLSSPRLAILGGDDVQQSGCLIP